MNKDNFLKSKNVFILPLTHLLRRHVAQSVERRTLEVKVRGSKPALDTWWWGSIPPNQPFPKGAAPAATTQLAEWSPEFPGKGLI